MVRVPVTLRCLWEDSVNFVGGCLKSFFMFEVSGMVESCVYV